MKTYIYNESESPKRGYNIMITVYRVINNIPQEIGMSHHSSAAWKGAGASAAEIIIESGVKVKKFDGYIIHDGGIKLYEIGSSFNQAFKTKV